MAFDTLPMPFGANAPAGVEDFRITAPAEIVDLLRRLQDDAVLIHLHASNGASLTTRLVTVDLVRETIGLAADVGDGRVERMLESRELTAVGYLDSVKIQFELDGAMLVRSGRDVTLTASLPSDLYRFQRRNAFRVRPIGRTAPTAYLPHPSMPEMQLALRILDISAGGCALFMPDDVPPIAPGVRINGVRVEIDADTDFGVGLVLHHITAIHPDSGGARLGCEWVGLTAETGRQLQRFIDQSQKQRRRLPAA